MDKHSITNRIKNKPESTGEKKEEKQVTGHDTYDLERYLEITKHMIVFDVLNEGSTVGFKGERVRLFLSEDGYEKALTSQSKGQIKILQDFNVVKGDIHKKGKRNEIEWS